VNLKSGDLVVLKVNGPPSEAPVLGVAVHRPAEMRLLEGIKSLIMPFSEHVIEPGRPYFVTSVDVRAIKSHIPLGVRRLAYVVLLDTGTGREFMARRILFRRLG
jgi:hypothetical protein